MTASTSNIWAVAGLVYALAGASLLALSVFAAPHPVRAGHDRDMRRSIEQWLDARIGAGLIVAGFFLQMTGSVGTATLNTPGIFVLLGLALAAGYYGLSKDLIVEKLAAEPARAAPGHETAMLELTEAVAVSPVALVPLAEPKAIEAPADKVVIDMRRESAG